MGRGSRYWGSMEKSQKYVDFNSIFSNLTDRFCDSVSAFSEHILSSKLVQQFDYSNNFSMWWFQIFFMFTPICGIFPF